MSNRVELALWYEARVHEGKFRGKRMLLKGENHLGGVNCHWRTALETRAAQSEKAGPQKWVRGARAKIQVHSSTYMQD